MDHQRLAITKDYAWQQNVGRRQDARRVRVILTNLYSALHANTCSTHTLDILHQPLF